ncbi:MAG: transposase [Solobacterium sp.]|nr:transposase [Solobacterium sp.]
MRTILFCDVSYRAVRFKLDGSEEYESIVTNLPREAFSPAEIKELYHLRWSEEISFRHLKYSADLSAVHA